MRVYRKRELISLLKTMQHAHIQIEKKLFKISAVELYQCLMELQDSAIAIGNAIEETGENIDIVRILEDYCECAFQCTQVHNNYLKKNELDKMQHKCDLVYKKVLDEIRRDKLQMVFMPYKADMWTSFESIWREAGRDKENEITVVPIPYYDISNPQNVKFCYEIERFPAYVKVENYLKYDLEKMHPDIIFIHNPYDEYNNLTRVPEQYYTYNLKQNSGILVYSPYFTIGSVDYDKQNFMFTMPGVLNSDYVITQSERVKQIFEEYGIDENKLLSYGSPKIDAVVLNERKKIQIDDEWQKKIKGKKVFLLNTHLSYFPKAFDYENSMDNYAVKFHMEIIDTFLNDKNCALIWRPHPLLKNMLRGRFPECLEFVEYFENIIREADNGIIDENGDYYQAFYCSDALISTWSSLINEYMVTGKPILIMQKRLSDKIIKQSPINRNVNYFRVGSGRTTFSQFRDNVIDNFDPLYGERMREIRTAFPNINGDAGKKIYTYLKSVMKGEV